MIVGVAIWIRDCVISIVNVEWVWLHHPLIMGVLAKFIASDGCEICQVGGGKKEGVNR